MSSEIIRPAFKSGKTSISMNANMIKPPKKIGERSDALNRPALSSASLGNRVVTNFEELDEDGERQNGLKVQLSDKTLKQLFMTRVPDARDTAWIDEYDRRITAGETPEQIKASPPFNRKQYTIETMKNFGQENVTTRDRLDMINNAFNQARIETRQDKALILAQLADILSSSENIELINTEMQLQSLQKAAKRAGMVKNWEEIPTLKSSQIDNSIMRGENAGLISLYLLTNIPKSSGLSSQFPIFKITRGVKKPASLSALFNLAANEVFDIVTRTIMKLAPTPTSTRLSSRADLLPTFSP
tara:strand:+ start:49 stop:951 length:903 start_codon:yes stop_codon:yes gene_type:complete